MELNSRRTANCRNQSQDRNQAESYRKTKKLRHHPNHRRPDQKTAPGPSSIVIVLDFFATG